MVPVAGLCDTDSNELLSLTLLQPTKIEACVCAQEEYTNNIESNHYIILELLVHILHFTLQYDFFFAHRSNARFSNLAQGRTSTMTFVLARHSRILPASQYRPKLVKLTTTGIELKPGGPASCIAFW